MQQIIDLLGVDKKAGDFLNMVTFLFQGNLDFFIDKCKDKSSGFMHSFLYDYRKDMIKRTRFASFEEFNDTYNTDDKTALERLFQEPISKWQMDRFNCNDTMTIYNLHLNNPEIRFDRFSMQFM